MSKMSVSDTCYMCPTWTRLRDIVEYIGADQNPASRAYCVFFVEFWVWWMKVSNKVVMIVLALDEVIKLVSCLLCLYLFWWDRLVSFQKDSRSDPSHSNITLWHGGAGLRSWAALSKPGSGLWGSRTRCGQGLVL